MIKTGQSKAAKAENMSKNTGVTNEVMHFPDQEYGSRSGSFYKMHVVFVIDNTVQPPSPGMEWRRVGKWRQRWDMTFGLLLHRLASCFTVGTGSSFSDYKPLVNFQVSQNSGGWKDKIPVIGLDLKAEDKVIQPSTTSCNNESGFNEIWTTVCLFL